jgi:undecaprenyl-diphosphatase
MSPIHALLLGALQGLTEFLPISSSGHLALVEHYLDLPFPKEPLQHFDVVLHAGSLVAILVYFWRTWMRVLTRPFERGPDEEAPLLLMLLLSIVPAAIVGWFLGEAIASYARFPITIGVSMLITGWMLIGSAIVAETGKKDRLLTWGRIITMSLFQAVAILPGISRSGATISGGSFLRMEGGRSAEVAFLMGGPALAGAIVYTALKGGAALGAFGWPALAAGFVSALLSSLIVIHFFILLTKKYGVWMWSLYLFFAAITILSMEMLPDEVLLQRLGGKLPIATLASIAAVAVLLEAVPLTSFFLPGGTTLWIIGVILRNHVFGLTISLLVATIAAIIGHLIAYIPAVLAREKIHWKPEWDRRLERAHMFFEKWGFWAVLVGGWFAPTRPFISIAAGLSEMSFWKYFLAISLGAILWTGGILSAAALLSRVLT